MSISIKQNVKKPSFRLKKNTMNRTNKIYIKSLADELRTYLIIIETKNVQIRRKQFEQIINDETQNVNAMVFGNDNIKNQHKKFAYSIDDDKMKRFLSYIYEWKGFSQSTNLPKTRKEYEKKARNWLNGRRAKKYGNTLFVDMLKHCRKYATYVASIYFEDKNKTEATNKKLYYQLLLYSFLSSICSTTITLYKSVRTTYLISQHAITAKTETKQLIQQLVNKYNSKLFPCHRDEAMDYFKKQYESTLDALCLKRNGDIVQNNQSNQIDIMDNKQIKQSEQYDISSLEAAESFITDIVNNKTVNSDGSVSIEMNKFCTLLNIINDLGAKHVQSEKMINLLNEKVQKLEYKNAAYIDGASNVIAEKRLVSRNATNSDPFRDYYNIDHSMFIDGTESLYHSTEQTLMDNLSVSDGFNYYDFNGINDEQYYSQFNSI